MKNKMTAILITTLLLSFVSTVSASACTIFMQEDGSTVLTGNNEDWNYASNTYMLITAPEEDSYGRVTFYISSYVQGGMNEEGLFYDSAVCPNSDSPIDKNKETLSTDFGEVILSKCKTVDEVIEFFKKYNYPWSDHMLFTDASGDSIVLEWVKRKMEVIRKEEKNYQLITNFWLKDPSLGGYPCNRFSTAKKMLETGSVTIEHFADILNSTKQDWGNGGTLYSNVYDLTNGSVYIFQSGDFDATYKVDLKSELANMEPGETKTEAINEMEFNQTIAEANHIADNKGTALTEEELPILGVTDYSVLYGIGALITGTIAFKKGKK